MNHSQMRRLLYDPLSRRLYTDRGELIKELKCPWSAQSLKLSAQENWHCQNCQKELTPTWEHSPEELLLRVKQEPELCLILDPHHEELELIFDHDRHR